MSDELPPGTLSLEPGTLETPPITQTAEQDDAEPDGVIEVQGRKVVDVSVLSAERQRAREKAERATREAVTREYEPIRAEAAEAKELRQALAEARPYIELVRQHPELLTKPQPAAPQISDEDAAQEARDLQLYDAQGVPDIATAKRVIAKRRAETAAVARQAAAEAVGPLAQTNATQASRQHFVAMASQRDADGQPLVNAKDLASLWTQFPAELTQHPEVAQVILDAAIGRARRTGQRTVAPPAREPVYSEAPGGRQAGPYTMSRIEQVAAKAAGMTTKDFETRAKTYQPNTVNVIGD